QTKKLTQSVRKSVGLTCITMLISFTSLFGQNMQTGYASVNGLKMYYEVHGSGEPILLLHGSFMTINLTFSQLIPELSKTRKVVAVEIQGHGHNADIERVFSFESMADDVAACLKLLKIDHADVLGYSMGGAVALQLVIRHPEIVRKLILISTAFKSDGW